jgi:multidrug efflux pump subunit AcrB
MNVQLPEAASMQRANAVMQKIGEILMAEPGVRFVNAVSEYSLLSQTASPRSGLYLVQLAPYDERATRALQSGAIVASVNRSSTGCPRRRCSHFSRPPSPRRPGRRRRRLHPGSRGNTVDCYDEFSLRVLLWSAGAYRYPILHEDPG